jgi:hypothetical protein
MRILPTPFPDPRHLLCTAAELAIFRLGSPPPLARNFTGLATPRPVAELLVKAGAGIRGKPSFATGTFFETRLYRILH